MPASNHSLDTWWSSLVSIRTISRALMASSTAVIAYVKPCTVHALNPQHLASFTNTIINVSTHAHELIELGDRIALGRYQPGSGHIGHIVSIIIRDACGGGVGYCPHGLAANLALYTIAFSFAARRGRVERDTLVASLQSVVAHTGSRDVEEVLKSLEVASPHDYEKLREKLYLFEPSTDFRDFASAVQELNPSYTCIVDASKCVRLSSSIGDPFNRVSLVSFWVEKLMPRCISVSEPPRPDDAKTLLSLDVECRRRMRGGAAACLALGELESILAFIAALLPS